MLASIIANQSRRTTHIMGQQYKLLLTATVDPNTEMCHAATVYEHSLAQAFLIFCMRNKSPSSLPDGWPSFPSAMTSAHPIPVQRLGFAGNHIYRKHALYSGAQDADHALISSSIFIFSCFRSAPVRTASTLPPLINVNVGCITRGRKMSTRKSATKP